MPMPLSAAPWRHVLFALLLVGGTLGANCGQPRVSIQTPGEAQVVDDPSVLATGTVARALDETTGELIVDGVDLLDALGVVPPFANVAGVVVIDGAPVQVSEFSWTGAPGQADTVSVRLAGLPADAHLLELKAFDPGPAVVRSVSRAFLVSEPLALVLEAFDAGGLRAGAQALPLGEASAASLGAALSAGEIPIAGGESIREGLPAAAAALGGTP
jgi:hypothetical protein